MSSEDSKVKRLVVERRKRVVATILGRVEREWLKPGKIKRDEYEEFRTVVLEAINAWHDLVLDIIKVGDEDTMRNDHAVDLLEQVHRSQMALHNRTGGTP